nr:DNA methyltransferase [Rhodoplanes tepidamans]
MGTRLSRIHPYPAMVPDELALSLVSRFVPPDASVLDPFCGSGRLLAAATRSPLRVGIDINPLAWLLTQAKFAKVDPRRLRAIIAGISRAEGHSPEPAFLVGPTERKVKWFSKSVIEELSRVVQWLNSLDLSKNESLLVAAALSAAVRDVSFAREQGWKLHRLDAESRRKFRPCPWDRLARRLTYCLEELSKQSSSPCGRTIVKIGDSRTLACSGESPVAKYGPFDVVLTSPPYGDSRSTVQYGAASSLCLSVVSHLIGFDHLRASGGSIDSGCLGGAPVHRKPWFSPKPYWSGADQSPQAASISKYLSDYDAVCDGLVDHLSPDGKAVFVVARRSAGGYRLKLDEFTIDCFSRRGFILILREERPLSHKRTPRLINRFGRDATRRGSASALVPTMNSEIVVVMARSSVPGVKRRSS